LQNYGKYIYKKNFSILFMEIILYNTDNQWKYFIHNKLKTTIVEHFSLLKSRNS